MVNNILQALDDRLFLLFLLFDFFLLSFSAATAALQRNLQNFRRRMHKAVAKNAKAGGKNKMHSQSYGKALAKSLLFILHLLSPVSVAKPKRVTPAPFILSISWIIVL